MIHTGRNRSRVDSRRRTEPRHQRPDAVEGARSQPVVGEATARLGPDQPGLAQDPEVVGDEGLLEVELVLQVADAQLLGGEQLQHSEPDRVGDDSQQLDDTGRLISGH